MFYQPWVPGLLYEMAAEFERTRVAKIPEGRRAEVVQVVCLSAIFPRMREAYFLLLDSLLLTLDVPSPAASLDRNQLVPAGFKSLPDEVLAAVALDKKSVSRLAEFIGGVDLLNPRVAPDWADALDGLTDAPDSAYPNMRPTSELVEEALGPFITPEVIERLRKYEAAHPDEFRPETTSCDG